MPVDPNMSRAERDKLIASLRAKDWTLRRIADHVGMSFRGVSFALERMELAKEGLKVGEDVDEAEGWWP